MYIYKTTLEPQATGEGLFELKAVVHSFVEFYKPTSAENARVLHLNGLRVHSMTSVLMKEYVCVVANTLAKDGSEHLPADEGREPDTVVHVADSSASKGMTIHRMLTLLCGEM